jgi:multidrug efflux pump subunit AcrB
VPLSALADLKEVGKPLRIDQIGLRPSAVISFEPAAGVSLGAAVRASKDDIERTDFPPTVSTSLAGEARELEDMRSAQLFLILGAVFVMYVVLAVLYESLVYP